MKINRKLVLNILKIVFTFVLLYFVFSRIPMQEIAQILKKSNVVYLLFGLICFVLSQIVSANRLLGIMKWSGFELDANKNYVLYLVGMFYNFFIPGGIGGDAYKIYILNKENHWPIKKLTSIVFVDRLMGLIAIGILIVIFCFFIPYFYQENLIWLLITLLILGVLFAYFLIKLAFNSFLGISFQSILKSIVVQILQCFCVVFLLISLSENDNFFKYIIAFLLSSVLSLFSFSGIGVREMILFQASKILVFDDVKAVTIGLLFSILTAFVSLFGIYFHFKKQLKI